MKTVFRFELRRGRTMTLIFTAACTALIILVMALYPMMKDMLGDMSEMFANMGEYSEMFSMGEMDYASAQDYYATEGGMVIALCGAALAAFLGGSLLGREEGEHTAEWLLTHPVSRSRIFFGKLFSMAVHLLFINIVCAVLTGISFPLINEPLNIKTFSLFFLAQFVMHMETGCISLLLSSVMRRAAGPVGLGIAMVMYFLSLISAAAEELEFITYITPFSYSDASAIFTDGSVDIVKLGIGVAVMLICGISAHVIWCKKDISA